MLYTKKILGDKVSVLDSKAFKFYLERSKNRNKKRLNQSRHYAKIISNIYEKIAEGALEYEGGVYAKGAFYIIPQPYPKKMFVRITNGRELKGTMNLHTDGKVYGIFFANLFSKKEHQVWDMYNGFFKSFTTKFSKILNEAKVNYIFSLDSILKIRTKI